MQQGVSILVGLATFLGLFFGCSAFMAAVAAGLPYKCGRHGWVCGGPCLGCDGDSDTGNGPK